MALTTYQEELVKAVANAVLPWNIGEKINVPTWDTQEQIEKCCNCCFADCTDCLSMKKTVGRGNKRDTTMFDQMFSKGESRVQICNTLGISKATYFRMVKQYKGEHS